MEKNTLKWFDTEYCGSAHETIQPVLVNDTVLYVLYDNKGFNYVFTTVYAIHLHWSGVDNQYAFTCGSEEDLIDYLENYFGMNTDNTGYLLKKRELVQKAKSFLKEKPNMEAMGDGSVHKFYYFGDVVDTKINSIFVNAFDEVFVDTTSGAYSDGEERTIFAEFSNDEMIEIMNACGIF